MVAALLPISAGIEISRGKVAKHKSSIPYLFTICRCSATAAQGIRNTEVASSSLVIGSLSGCSASGSTLVLGTRSCRFESCHSDENTLSV